MKEILKKAFIEGYKQRAEGSDLIFDETSKMYAEHIFEKWAEKQLLSSNIAQQRELLIDFYECTCNKTIDREYAENVVKQYLGN